uniref:Uncharacterized protein n=1 Tax=Arundo donax TaxID=35708 RepID=A0A0A9HFP7_ARUDO
MACNSRPVGTRLSVLEQGSHGARRRRWEEDRLRSCSNCLGLSHLARLRQAANSSVIGSCHTKELGNSNINLQFQLAYTIVSTTFKLLWHKNGLLSKDVLLTQR